MNKGWIKLHRQILECDIWIGLDDEEDEPFDKRSAWIDLLLRANHRDKQMVFNYEPIVVTRGQLITSVRKLAKRWSWSVTKTYKYLKLLSNLGMIEKQSDTSKTLLTIVNYGIYQDDGNTSETETKRIQNANETQSGHKQEYKECKELKKDINIYMSFPLKDGTEYPIDESFVSEMKELYPRLDVEQEFKSAKAWLIGNPTKQKTAKGMKRFLTGWLGRVKPDAPNTSPKPNKFNDFESTRKYDFAALEGEVANK